MEKIKREIKARMVKVDKEDGSKMKMYFPDGYRIHRKTGQIINPDKPRNKYGRVVRKSKKQRLRE